MAGIVNPMPTLKIFPSKPYSPVDNLYIPIKQKPALSIFDTVTPFCIDTDNILSVTPDKKFVIPFQDIMTNRG